MRFIVTPELGRLAKWLRILGFDTMVEGRRSDLVIKSLREERIILTRDSRMSRFTGTRMIKIESDYVREQLAQAVRDLDLAVDKDGIFKRCVLCNQELVPAEKAETEGTVPAYVFESGGPFLICRGCNKIYWRGSHWALVNEFLKTLDRKADRTS